MRAGRQLAGEEEDLPEAVEAAEPGDSDEAADEEFGFGHLS